MFSTTTFSTVAQRRAAVNLCSAFIRARNTKAHLLLEHQTTKLTEHDISAWITQSGYQGTRPDLDLLNMFILEYNKNSSFIYAVRQMPELFREPRPEMKRRTYALEYA